MQTLLVVSFEVRCFVLVCVWGGGGGGGGEEGGGKIERERTCPKIISQIFISFKEI